MSKQTQQQNSQYLQPSEAEVIRQIEHQLSPVVIGEVKKEYNEKKKTESNISYQKESQGVKRSSAVNPSQLQYRNNGQEDEDFLRKLVEITKEFGLLGGQLQGAKKLSEKYKAPLITMVEQFNNNVKMLYDCYRKKLPIIKLNRDYQTKLDSYKTSLEQINTKLVLLVKVGFCGKSRLNKEIKWAGELLRTHDNVIQAWLNLEPRDIILNSGEVIIEKIVETEPNEEKIRALVAKYIKDYLPKQKIPEPIIQTQTKTVYLPAEPDQLGKAHHLLYGLKNYAEALKLLRELDAKNHPDGQATLGTVYLEGMGVKKNIPKAVEYFKKAIKGGSAEAMYKLATLLEKGLHMEAEDRQTNIVKAIEYYKKAALKDDLNALTDLAFLLENGKYVQKDINEAHTLLKRASDLYFPRALNNLGSMYFKGLITDKGRPNDQKAFELFKLAHDQGYAKAYTNLGICYEKGRAVPKSLVKAVEFYTQAADLGDVDGIFHLAYYTMEEASYSNEIDKYSEAADLFLDAISKDPEYAEAYYYMGFLYEHGLGVDHDMTTAFRNYKKGAELDHAKSWTKLGTFYSKGVGAPKNPKTSVMCYERAGELGDDEALNLLGIIYEEGIEVEPDYDKAYDFYQASSDMGNSKAKLNLGLMFERGRVEKNMEEAVNLYVDAADHGNVTAQMMLSTRDLNTVYRGSMSKIIGREDTTVYDNMEYDTVATDHRSGSPNQDGYFMNTNAISQYMRGTDVKPYMNNLRDQSIPEYDDEEGEGTYRNSRGAGKNW